MFLPSCSDCVKAAAFHDDGWTEHQCFDLNSCLVDKYDGTVLHNLRFSWLQFDGATNFWIDEFILIDISMTGFGNYEGEHIKTVNRAYIVLGVLRQKV